MHRITVDKRAGVTVLEAAGELDAYVAPQLVAALGQARGEELLVADLSAVSFLDSTALGILVRGVRDREGRGIRTRVLLPLGTARRIFEITALDRALPVSSSFEEAVR